MLAYNITIIFLSIISATMSKSVQRTLKASKNIQQYLTVGYLYSEKLV